MKREFVKRVVSLALAAGLLLTTALAAEPESVKEFRNGKTKMIGSGFGGAALVLQQDGSLWGWGRVDTGLLGNNGSFDKEENFLEEIRQYRTYPEKVLTGVEYLELKASASGIAIVIKEDGSLWYSGTVSKVNTFGMQRTSTEYTKNFVKLADHIVSASAGATSIETDFAMDSVIDAVKENGELLEFRFVRVDDKESFDDNGAAVPGGYHFEVRESKLLDSVKKVSCGIDHAIALKTDGSVWAWGSTAQGQIGNGEVSKDVTGNDNSSHVIAKPIKVLDGVKDIYAGDCFSAAIKKDGTLWVWGMLPSGNQGTPVKVADAVKKVSADTWGSTIAIVKQDGTLGLWGYFADTLTDNFVKQNGEDSYKNGIIQTTITDVADIAVSTETVLFVTPSGDLFSLRDNSALKNFGSVAGIEKPVQLAGFSSTTTTTTAPTQTATAKPTAFKILLDGKSASLDAYNINANNYCKIRDVAMLLNGTGKQFEVTWDKTLQAVSMTSNHAYTTVGGELAEGDGESKTATLNTAKIYLDGKEVSLTAYNIGGNNYIKLRDLGQAFDFDVRWDGATSSIVVDTTKGYTG